MDYPSVCPDFLWTRWLSCLSPEENAKLPWKGVAIGLQWASLATAGRRWFAPLPSHLKAARRHRLWCKRTLLRSVRSEPHLLAGGHWPARITGWIHFTAECLAFAQELHNASPVAHDPSSRYFAEVKAWQGAKRRAVVLVSCWMRAGRCTDPLVRPSDALRARAGWRTLD